MKVKEVHILDEEFDYEKYYGKKPDYEVLKRNKTAEVIFLNEEGKEEKKYYGYVEKESIYNTIKNEQEINLNTCYVESFSLDEYRNRNNLPTDTLIDIKSLSAINSIFKEANFRKAQFSGNAYFSSTQFSGLALFNSVQFSGYTYFSSAQFSGCAYFSFARFSGTANFFSSQFLERTNFEYSMFRNSASFNNLCFHQPAFFSKCEFNETDFYGTVFKEYDLFKECDIKNATRETFRIIKHELVKTDNKLDASLYHKREMNAYLKELLNKKWYKSLPDIFILVLNKISNNFGTNWGVGVIFTLVIALIFFYLYVHCLDNPNFKGGWSEWLGYYAKFLYAGHSFDFMKDFKPNGYGYIVDLISRIFIGYGYYQVIQPMRKYKMW